MDDTEVSMGHYQRSTVQIVEASHSPGDHLFDDCVGCGEVEDRRLDVPVVDPERVGDSSTSTIANLRPAPSGFSVGPTARDGDKGEDREQRHATAHGWKRPIPA